MAGLDLREPGSFRHRIAHSYEHGLRRSATKAAGSTKGSNKASCESRSCGKTGPQQGICLRPFLGLWVGAVEIPSLPLSPDRGSIEEKTDITDTLP